MQWSLRPVIYGVDKFLLVRRKKEFGGPKLQNTPPTLRQNLVLEYISKLRASKITSDVGFRIKRFDYIGQSCRLLKSMVLRQNMCQIVFGEYSYNYVTSKNYVLNCF